MSTGRNKSRKKAEETKATTSNKEYGTHESDSEKPGTPIRRRKSLRLKKKREQQTNQPKTGTLGKRKLNADKGIQDGLPLKKKSKTSHRSKKNSLAIPSFVHDIEFLKEIGIAYTKKTARGKGKILYKKKVTVNGDEYHYHSRGKYELLEVLRHRLQFEPDTVLKADPNEQNWHKSMITSRCRLALVNDKETSNGNDVGAEQEKKMHIEKEDENVPQCQFGRVYFECKWAKWPETTWEHWNVIAHTPVFEKYCEEIGMIPKHELDGVLKAHTTEQFFDIIRNMAHFGSPTTRKALKQIINHEMNLW